MINVQVDVGEHSVWSGLYHQAPMVGDLIEIRNWAKENPAATTWYRVIGRRWISFTPQQDSGRYSIGVASVVLDTEPWEPVDEQIANFLEQIFRSPEAPGRRLRDGRGGHWYLHGYNRSVEKYTCLGQYWTWQPSTIEEFQGVMMATGGMTDWPTSDRPEVRRDPSMRFWRVSGKRVQFTDDLDTTPVLWQNVGLRELMRAEEEDGDWESWTVIEP